MRFVDTNVLLYAVSTAKNEADKSARARQLLRSIANDIAGFAIGPLPDR